MLKPINLTASCLKLGTGEISTALTTTLQFGIRADAAAASFTSKSVMEARFRIQSNLTAQPIFSVQEMITCGADMNYNQGCSGGFSYLTAGKAGLKIIVHAKVCSRMKP